MKLIKYACALKYAVILVSFLALTSCGGGGGGGGGGGSASPTPPPPVVLSGMVQAPAGSVAFCPEPVLMEKLQKFFVPSAYAAVTGISAVPNGTVVELVRVDSAGNTLTILATTVVSAGTYSFNLTTLGLTFSSDLVIQVRNQATGARMRAFVTSETVNIDPVSEAAVDMVLERIAAVPGSSLAHFTAKELEDLVGSIHVLTTAQQMAAALDIRSTVTAIKTASAGDTNITAFLASASAIGQSADGPGDVGNFFPTAQGTSWAVKVTVSQNGQPSTTYNDTLTITGTKNINGVEALVFSQPNPGNSGTPRESYRAKNSSGMVYYGNGDSSDHLTPQYVPYDEIRFPLWSGNSFTQLNKTGIDYGQDVDGDGIHETCSIATTVTVAGFETVTVPAGTFPNSARIETRLTAVCTLSRSGSSGTQIATDTSWYARGAGQIKGLTSMTSGGTTVTTIYEVTSITTGLGDKKLDFDVVDAEYSKQLDKLVIVSSLPANQLHVYNPVTRQDVAVTLPLLATCVSVSPDGLFAAVGHNGWVSYVDLQTGVLIKTIPVSTNAFDVVLAGNGYAYVFPASDQWVQFHSIHIASGTETLGGIIREKTRAKLHPNGLAIYGAQNGLSPSDIEKYDISSGTATYLYNSPYHGDYAMNGDLWVSEDGLRLFTKAGNVFRSSAVVADDMLYNGALENLTQVRSLSHSAAVGKVAAIPEQTTFVWPGATVYSDTEVRIFNYEFLTLNRIIPLPAGFHGLFVFYDSTGTKMHVLVKTEQGVANYGLVSY